MVGGVGGWDGRLLNITILTLGDRMHTMRE